MTHAWFDDTVTPTIDYSAEHMPRSVVVPKITGRNRTRRLYQTTPVFITAQIICDDGQAALFESWFRSGAGADNGDAWFSFPSRLPQGQDKRSARFTGTYTGPVPVSGSNSRWSFRLPLELRNAP